MFPDRVLSAVVQPGKTFHYFSEETAHITNIAVCLKTESNKKISSTISPFVTVLKLLYEGPVHPSGKSFDEDEESSKKDPEDDDEDSQSGEFEEKEIVIGTFTPNTMQITTDLYLASTSHYQFVLFGSSEHEVHLHGRYIDEPYEDSSFDDAEESDDDIDEPDSDDISDDDSKFEELADDNGASAPKGKEISTGSSSSKKVLKQANVETESKKRPLEDKETDADVSMADSNAASITEGGPKLSKAQRKKLKKARLAETNNTVPEAKESAPANDTAPKTVAEPTDSAPKTVTLPSGLKIVDSKIGTGADAKAGQTILMRYIGKLANGTVFDSNTKGKAFSFKLGRGQVIKGWDEGIKGMKVGGERRLVIPANLAYGKSGSPPQIPPNSALTFDVKLLKIQ